MSNHKKGNTDNGQSQAGLSPPADPVTGTPSAPGSVEGGNQQQTGGESPPVDSGDSNDSAAGKPPAPPTSPVAEKGKKRIKCAMLKGKKITIVKGEVVQIDENGFFEVEEQEATRLLTIPGYEVS